jgi:hypothetical protein
MPQWAYGIRLMQSGYVSSGIRMSFWNAGTNNTSAMKLSTQQYMQYIHNMVEETPYLHNFGVDHDRMKREIQERRKQMDDHGAEVQLGNNLELVAAKVDVGMADAGRLDAALEAPEIALTDVALFYMVQDVLASLSGGASEM